ncbi:class I SAM-dependent methyltransferase [Kribbella sp. NPDC050124]|uniref:class I SAM-dependent methyltransferase n=1 Tax=Kribbella sp. NPDC050124 TaxID=3364114 RepID=UPI00379B02DB
MTVVVDADRRDAAVEQVFQATIGALELLHVYVGDRLGLYAGLKEVSDATPAELAARTGVAERYVREWLEEQAVAGFVDVTADNRDATLRRYRLPAGIAEVMTDPDSLNYLVPLAPLFVSIGQTLPAVLEAFRTGGGVPYADYGEDLRAGIARLNRPMFIHQLTDWIPALPDIEARLAAGPSRVADLGCGSGWSSIALAHAYPAVHVDGIDLDEGSVVEARHNAEIAGVADRVTFGYRDAGSPGLAGRYDLVTFFETVHDMADPVASLRAALALLAPGGAVLVADEKVAESFAVPGDDLERFNYGWSALCCLPSALTEAGSAGTGTVMRPDILRGYADAAGFASTTVLPIEHDFWRFYRLDP